MGGISLSQKREAKEAYRWRNMIKWYCPVAGRRNFLHSEICGTSHALETQGENCTKRGYTREWAYSCQSSKTNWNFLAVSERGKGFLRRWNVAKYSPLIDSGRIQSTSIVGVRRGGVLLTLTSREKEFLNFQWTKNISHPLRHSLQKWSKIVGNEASLGEWLDSKAQALFSLKSCAIRHELPRCNDSGNASPGHPVHSQREASRSSCSLGCAMNGWWWTWPRIRDHPNETVSPFRRSLFPPASSLFPQFYRIPWCWRNLPEEQLRCAPGKCF